MQEVEYSNNTVKKKKIKKYRRYIRKRAIKQKETIQMLLYL